MWSQLSEEQKKSYGEDYFERALRSLEKYIDKVRSSIILTFIQMLELNLEFSIV